MSPRALCWVLAAWVLCAAPLAAQLLPSVPEVTPTVPETEVQPAAPPEPTPEPIPEPVPEPRQQPQAFQSGMASWYGPGFHGRKTANGERFDQNALTAAHRTLAFGTRLRVVRQLPGGEERTVEVRINDRGPFIKGRIIDLSRAAAQALGIAGIGQVKLERIAADLVR